MQKNEKLNRVLGAQDKRAREADGVLSRAFRKIMAEMGVTMELWEGNMKRYLQDPRNRIPQNSKDISSARGNLVKELVRGDMSWKVFVKALKFLGPKSVRLKLEITWWNNRTTIHEIPVHTSDVDLTTPPEPVVRTSMVENLPMVEPIVTTERLERALQRSSAKIQVATHGLTKDPTK